MSAFEPVRVGVLGCGVVAQRTYFPGIAASPDIVSLVAVCDPVKERAEQQGKLYNVPNIYSDYQQLLDNPEVELVIILTPMQTHVALATQALEAGKHVYTEKVMAPNVADATTIIDTAKRCGKLLGSAPAVMLGTANRRIKEVLQSGEIGRVCYARASHSSFGPANWKDFTSDPTWFYKPGGGPLFDLAVYAVHTLTGLLGPAKRMSAFTGIAIPQRTVVAGEAAGKVIDVEVPDNDLIMLDFGNATFAVLDGTYTQVASKAPRNEIYCSEGAINVTRQGEVEIFRRETGWEPLLEAGAGRSNFNLVNGVLNMAESIRTGAPLIVNGEHARHCIEILSRAPEASQQSRVIELETTF